MAKRIAVFDIDGTIFRNSLLIELHWKMVKAGLIKRSAIKTLDKRYWEWIIRKRHYDDYLKEVIVSFDKAVKGVSVSVIRALARSVVKRQSNIVYRFTRDLVNQLRKTHTLVAISGSPSVVVEEFVRVWKFDHFVATQHEIINGRYGKKVFVASTDKRTTLRDLIKQKKLSLKNSVGVGDSESDMGIFSLVTKPICFNPTAKLYALAKRRKWPVVVERKDMIYHL